MEFTAPLKLEECSLYSAISCVSISELPVNERVFNLFCVTSGKGRVTTAFGSFELLENSCFVAFPFEVFSLTEDNNNPVIVDFVSFSVTAGKYQQALESIRIASLVDSRRVFDNPEVKTVVASLCNEAQNVESKDLLSLLCSQLIVYILRAFKDSISVEEVKDEGTAVGMCTKIMNYIDSRIFNIMNLSEVAVALGYNYCYISSVFKKVTGMTLNRYFLATRMKHAKKLIEEEGLNATKTAQMLGYSSVFSFSKAFKDFYGASPGKFKISPHDRKK